ncbi:hypothetical protein CBLAS_1150 [Campylobacter blaseri]|uniref:Protein kinase domain-containing protein n=1 Tax=Campylobacter blaseri TaxID=2042961 RepID=A0A2P8QZP9_9BACT|nr:hypothetical protein [Campylobacter blaseri]PSM51724.1 hypothetical protein CQ405_06230 [Campylobacter blaseri]PSM53515.1 hypothetical protein CRN67_06235 [Campylobacter blaseri]QKF86323.1 hypothetical protein CBLAS_1150 [Campylobacter blaseri]
MRYEINKDDKEVRNFILNIQDYFSNNDLVIHKARNEVKKIYYNDKNYIVKSFQTPKLLRRIYFTFFADSKAKKSYKNSYKIKEFVPTPSGYIEFFKNGLLGKSFFISEEYKYDFTIREPLLDKSFKDRENIFKEFALFTATLHKNNIFHKDYSPGNIIIKKLKNGYEFRIVDVNRMKFIKVSPIKALSNFMKLWIDDDDLAIMLKEYAKINKIDEENFVKKGLKVSNNFKKIKNISKKIRGRK